jgi:hypothetical protein
MGDFDRTHADRHGKETAPVSDRRSPSRALAKRL